MEKIELVVFDMAGTTVNDEDSVNRCVRDALRAAGLEVAAADVNRVMGLPKPRAIALLIEQYGRTSDLGPRIEAIHGDFVRRSIAFYASDPSVREVPGTSEVFDRLRSEGIRVAVNTGFDRAITDVILDRLGWVRDGSDRRIDRQRRGRERASAPGHDPRADAATRRHSGRPGRQGGRYSGRPGGREERRMWDDRRGDERDAFARGAGRVARTRISSEVSATFPPRWASTRATAGDEPRSGDRRSAIPRTKSEPHCGGFCDAFLGLIRP